MTTVKHHKVVASLPAVLEPNAIYYVRAGSGFDQYVTNGAGLVVASPLNADVRSKLLDPSGLPAIRPSLRLDFLNYGDRLDPRITCTRLTGGGRTNAQGQYEWLPANTPRIDYDPVTGECLGLLIEESRTNLIPNSDTSGGLWSGGGNLERNVTTGLPSPFSVAATLEHSASQLTFNYYQLFSPTAGTTYTFSVFVAYEDGRDVASEFGAPGTENSPSNPFTLVVNGNAYTWATVSKKPEAHGGYRLSVTITPSDNLLRGWGVLIRSTHKSVASKLLVTGYMIEAGSFPTSYIPTTTARVTRAADIASVNELSPWFNASEGTWLAEFQTFSTSGFPSVFNIYNDVFLFTNTSLAQKTYYLNGRGSTGFASASATTPKNAITKCAVAVDRQGASISLDGSSASSVIRAQHKDPLGLEIGRKLPGGAGGYLNGHIRVLRFYPKALPDQLQALTA